MFDSVLPGGVRPQFAGYSAQNVEVYLVEKKKHARKTFEHGFLIERCVVIFDSVFCHGDSAQIACHCSQNVELYLVENKKQVMKMPGDGFQTWRSAVAYYSLSSIGCLGYPPEEYSIDTAQ